MYAFVYAFLKLRRRCSTIAEAIGRAEEEQYHAKQMVRAIPTRSVIHIAR